MKLYYTCILSILIHISPVFAHTEQAENQADLFLKNLGNTHIIKCGTPRLLQMLSESSENDGVFKSAYGSLGRPEKDKFADSKLKHFRAHYDTSGVDAPDMTDLDKNGIPDFVDSTLVYLEKAWEKVIGYSYGSPKSDTGKGGSDAVDCYIEDLSGQLMYGFTSPDNNGIMGMTSSYITIDNNYTDSVFLTKGYDGLKITTAHEFFHVAQFSYYDGDDAIWWMEQTAVWFENEVWDEINDYLHYINDIFSDRDKPLNTHNNSFEYSACLFAFYIAEKYGNDTIRLIWRTFKDKQSGQLELLDSVLTDGLGHAISDFTVWLYFTGYRANSKDFFSEADIIKYTVSPERFESSVPAVDSLDFRHYTFKYIEIIPTKGLAAGDTLKYGFEDRDGGAWQNQLILYNAPDDYTVEYLSWEKPTVPITKSFQKAVLVMANTSEHSKVYTYIFKIDIKSRTDVNEKPLPQPVALNQNYPNPFNPSTTITYSVPSETPVTLFVLNMQGQIIRILEDRRVEAGAHSILFDGSGLPSGLYLLRLQAGDIRITKKMTLLK
ncbi:T9SS type A sorting domain-containing protein [bacterium]|nr:T9SS type A sorting domain-containing protein [bacterium]